MYISHELDMPYQIDIAVLSEVSPSSNFLVDSDGLHGKSIISDPMRNSSMGSDIWDVP